MKEEAGPAAGDAMPIEEALQLRSRLLEAARRQKLPAEAQAQPDRQHLPLLMEALDVLEEEYGRTTMIGATPEGWSWLQMPRLIWRQGVQIYTLPDTYRFLFYLWLVVSLLATPPLLLIGGAGLLAGTTQAWLLPLIVLLWGGGGLGFEGLAPRMGQAWQPGQQLGTEEVLQALAGKIEDRLVREGFMSERPWEDIASHPRTEEVIRRLQYLLEEPTAQQQREGENDG